MTRIFPKSLFGQTLLILLVGLVVSHAIGAWIYAGAREKAVRAVSGFAAAQRVANLSHLVEDAPPDWRPRIVAALSDATFHVWLSHEPPRQLPVDAEGAAAAIEDYVRQQLPAQPGRDVRAAVFAPVGPPDAPFGPPFNQGPYAGPMGGMRGMGSMMHQMMGPNFGVWRGLQVAVKLSDGQWLSFATTLPKGAPSVSWQFIISMVLMGVIVLVVSIWAVRRVTAPLGMLSGAADRLGRDVAAEPLAEAGTVEMQRAARAFNRMQERLRRLIESRTQMLAALSHDLRTPLTLLRLRTEEVADGEERDKMLATIAEMDEMIGSTLAFARDEVRAEPRRRVDIAALIESVVDDMADAGLPVSMTAAQPAIHECQPGALKRALTNLLDNAVKYGKRAQAALNRTPEAIEITIDDEGPGIPEAELAKVFQPFYRVEESRSRDTGGTGLGLAITQAIVQAHGGELTLANRPGGGLRATIKLPV
jgi:signal transduction histidine kinase